MAEPTRIPGDLYVTGNISAGTMSVPASAITDAKVAADAAIGATKLIHQHRVTGNQPNSAATSETRVQHYVYGGTGTVIDFSAGSIVANIGAATVTVDLKKNGTTILNAVITLNSSSTAYIVQSATFTSAALVADDVLSVVVVATAGGGTLATGVFWSLTTNEAAQ